MTVPIRELKGISPEVAAKLKAKGISNSQQLLNATTTTAERRDLAKSLGIEGAALTEMHNRADLARIKGIGAAYGDLLEEVGVDTVKELATRTPANLYARMSQVRTEKKLTTRMPTQAMIENWVSQAKELAG